VSRTSAGLARGQDWRRKELWSADFKLLEKNSPIGEGVEERDGFRGEITKGVGNSLDGGVGVVKRLGSLEDSGNEKGGGGPAKGNQCPG